MLLELGVIETEYFRAFLAVREYVGQHELAILITDMGHLRREIIQEEDRYPREKVQGRLGRAW